MIKRWEIIYNIYKETDESFDSYGFRIYKDKIVHGLKNQEIAELINSQFNTEFGESTLRCKFQDRIYGYEKAKQEIAEASNIYDKIIKKEIKLKEEQIKTSTMRTVFNKDIRENTRQDMIVQRMVEGSQNIEPYKFNGLSVNENIDRDYLLCISDIHAGKEFQSYNNFFNLEVLEQRMELLLQETFKEIESKKISSLKVLNLSDTIEGMCLRASQLQYLEFGIIDQVMVIVRLLVDWLNKLSSKVSLTYYHITRSNHAQIRPFSSKPSEFVKEDMERLIAFYIKEMLQANDRIEVVYNDKDFLDFGIFDFNCYAEHGHTKKIDDSFVGNISLTHRKFFDYVFVGHLHHTKMVTVAEAERNNIDIIRVPSIVGSDTFSDSLGKSAKAGALFIEFTEAQGKRSVTEIILNWGISCIFI